MHDDVHTLTFGILPEDIPAPTLIIRRKGGVKAVQPMAGAVDVLVVGSGLDRDWFGTTAAQRRAVQQLARAILHTSPLCEITFKSGVSPWALDYLYRADDPFMELHELMSEPYTRLSRYVIQNRLLKRHPIIQERLRARTRTPRH